MLSIWSGPRLLSFGDKELNQLKTDIPVTHINNPSDCRVFVHRFTDRVQSKNRPIRKAQPVLNLDFQKTTQIDSQVYTFVLFQTVEVYYTEQFYRSVLCNNSQFV